MGSWLRLDWLGLSAVLGVVLATHQNKWLVLGLFILCGYLCLSYKPLVILFIFCFVIYYTDAHFQESPHNNPRLGSSTVIGRIRGTPTFDGDHLSLVFNSDRHEAIYGTMYLKTLTEKKQLQALLNPGETCHFSGELSSPSGKRNTYGFNFQAYLAKQGIYSQMDLSSITNCAAIGLTPMERVNRLRQTWIQKASLQLPSPLNGLVLALVFGSKETLDPNDLTAYQTLGISHLLTVSGLHVGLLASFLLLFFKRIGLLNELGLALLLLVCLPVYILLTGSTPSVLRAGLMIGLFFLFRLIKTPISPVQTLTLVGLLLLLISPNLLAQLSFQLSFLVTYVILSSWRLLNKVPHEWTKLFFVSGIAEIGLLPLTLYQFFQLSCLSMVMNLFYVPFISFVILPVSFILTALCFLSPSLVSVFAFPFNELVKVTQFILLKCANWTYASVNIGRPSLLEEAVLVIGIFILFRTWEKHHSVLIRMCLPLGFVLVTVGFHFMQGMLQSDGRVVFFDVGQGDSIFIQLPHNRQTILIDTGGTLPMIKAPWQVQKKPFEVGRDVVLSELKGMGINHLDLLVLTHRDTDHIGGAKGIVGKMPIKTIVVSPYFVPFHSERIWLKKAMQMATALKIVHPGEEWEIGKAQFEVLWPGERTTTSNGTSLVIKGVFGGVSWLFTGDLEVPEEKKVLNNFPNLKVDILKVGHHGSQTATSEVFLKAIKPKLAIISVGEHNRYGHPNPEVLARLRQLKIPILRTDQRGEITISFNPSRLKSIQTIFSK